MMVRRISILVASLALSLAAVLAVGAGTANAIAPPTTLTLQTVPAFAGVRITFDGGQFVTGPSGSVTISTIAGPHTISVLPPSPEPAGTTVRFARWLDHSQLAHRLMMLHKGLETQQIGLAVSHAVSIRMVDPTGRQVSAADISRITLGNSTGQRFTFSPRRLPVSLVANHVLLGNAGLISVPVRYSIREVMMGGVDVVHVGAQGFFVGSSPSTWQVSALLFPMQIVVRDALFGFPIGHAVGLTLPNGATKTVDLGSNSAVTLPGLPRGLYRLAPSGLGIGLASPAFLSRPLTAKLLLFSWVDVTVVVLSGVLFVVGLPLVGGRLVRRQRGVRLPTWRSGFPAQKRNV